MKADVIEKLVSRLLKKFPKMPYSEELQGFLKKILILTEEQPAMGKEALTHFEKYFDDLIEKYLGEKIFLSKGQYIAIVGDSFIDEKAIINILTDYGIKKSNIRFCLDYNQYKSGKFSDLLNSDQCVAIIFGPIPHRAKNVDEKELAHKTFYATQKGGKVLKLTKESLRDILPEVIEKLKKNNCIKKGISDRNTFLFFLFSDKVQILYVVFQNTHEYTAKVWFWEAGFCRCFRRC